MNRKNLIITSTAAIVSLVAVSGFAFRTFAADSTGTPSNTGTGTASPHFWDGWGKRAPLTDAQKAQMEADRQKRQAAMDQAIEGGYDTWVAYVKGINANAPILQKINADNFAKFKEAYEHMKAARTIMTDLGIEGKGMGMGMGMEFGMGGGMMGGRGMHRGMMNDNDADDQAPNANANSNTGTNTDTNVQ